MTFEYFAKLGAILKKQGELDWFQILYERTRRDH
jgi:hypothetical protein